MALERSPMLHRLIRWIRTHNQKVILISSVDVIKYMTLMEVSSGKKP